MNVLISGTSGVVGELLCVELFLQSQFVRVAVRSATRQVLNIKTVSVGKVNLETDRTNALLGKTLDIHFAAGGCFK